MTCKTHIKQKEKLIFSLKYDNSNRMKRCGSHASAPPSILLASAVVHVPEGNAISSLFVKSRLSSNSCKLNGLKKNYPI